MINNIYFNIKEFVCDKELVGNKCIKTLIHKWNELDLYNNNRFIQAENKMDLMYQNNIQLEQQINKMAEKMELLTKINLYENKKLEEFIEKCQSSSVIDLCRQKLTDEDMGIVVKQAIIKKQCKVLWLAENNITSVGISIVADALHNNTTLEQLYLQYNYISDDGVHSFVEPLSNNNTLKMLGLGHNQITDESAIYLAEIIKTNRGLTELLLWENQISDEGVEILADEIQFSNTNLQVLNLGENPFLTDVSVDFLLPIIKNITSLMALIIYNCNLTQIGKERLIKTVEQLTTDVKVYM